MTGFSMSNFNSTCAEIFNTIREIKKYQARQDIQRGLVPWFDEFTGQTTEEGLKNGLSLDTVVPHGDTHQSTDHDVANVFVDFAAPHGSVDACPPDPRPDKQPILSNPPPFSQGFGVKVVESASASAEIVSKIDEAGESGDDDYDLDVHLHFNLNIDDVVDFTQPEEEIWSETSLGGFAIVAVTDTEVTSNHFSVDFSSDSVLDDARIGERSFGTMFCVSNTNLDLCLLRVCGNASLNFPPFGAAHRALSDDLYPISVFHKAFVCLNPPWKPPDNRTHPGIIVPILLPLTIQWVGMTTSVEFNILLRSRVKLNKVYGDFEIWNEVQFSCYFQFQWPDEFGNDKESSWYKDMSSERSDYVPSKEFKNSGAIYSSEGFSEFNELSDAIEGRKELMCLFFSHRKSRADSLGIIEYFENADGLQELCGGTSLTRDSSSCKKNNTFKDEYSKLSIIQCEIQLRGPKMCPCSPDKESGAHGEGWRTSDLTIDNPKPYDEMKREVCISSTLKYMGLGITGKAAPKIHGYLFVINDMSSSSDVCHGIEVILHKKKVMFARILQVDDAPEFVAKISIILMEMFMGTSPLWCQSMQAIYSRNVFRPSVTFGYTSYDTICNPQEAAAHHDDEVALVVGGEHIFGGGFPAKTDKQDSPSDDYIETLSNYGKLISAKLLIINIWPTTLTGARRVQTLRFYGETSTVMMSDVSQLLKTTIVGGSIPERCKDRLYNTCCVFGSDGKLKAKHGKIHLFDIDIPGKITIKESMTLTVGKSPTVVETDVGRIGIGICYDIHFQEPAMLYAARAAHLICYPGAFNMPTGPLHWELLQRARATDNQLYFIIHTMSGSYILTPILKERSAKPPAKPPDNIYDLHVDDMRLVWGFDKTMSHFAEIILRYTNLNGEVGLDEVNIMKLNIMHDMKRVSSLPSSFYQGIDILGDKVEKPEKVIIFDCIMHSPCYLIIDEYGWIKDKRIMKAQALTESSLVVYMSNTETTMEINPEKSIMEEPRKRFDAKKKDKCAVDWAKLLFDGVLLQSNFSLNHLHTSENNSQCHKMLRLGLTIDVAEAREDFDNALIVDWMLHDEVTDSVCLARFANNFFMFSLSRPPEIATLRTRSILRAWE